MTPRRFEVHPGAAKVPADLLAWAVSTAVEHEQEWGLGEEDVGIVHPLCGTRGPVGAHVDNDYIGSTLICGLILEGRHDLVCAETAMHLPLAPGTLYVLDPATEHGTSAGHDDRLLFLVDTFEETDTASPVELAVRLIAKGRATMERERKVHC